MTLANHKGHSIQDCGVDPLLGGKSFEGVPVALDLVAMKAPVDDGDIHPGTTIPKAQFVENKRVCIAVVLCEHLRVESSTYVRVAHHTEC